MSTLLVQLLSHVRLSESPCMSGSPVFHYVWSLLKFVSFELVMLSNHPLSPPSLPALGFSQYWSLLQWIVLVYWNFSFTISPSNDNSGLTIFKIDWSKYKGLSRVFSSTTIQKHHFLDAHGSLWFAVTSIHDYWKNHSFDCVALYWSSDVSAF